MSAIGSEEYWEWSKPQFGGPVRSALEIDKVSVFEDWDCARCLSRAETLQQRYEVPKESEGVKISQHFEIMKYRYFTIWRHSELPSLDCFSSGRLLFP